MRPRCGPSALLNAAVRKRGACATRNAALKTCKPATLAGSLDALRQFAQLAATREPRRRDGRNAWAAAATFTRSVPREVVPLRQQHDAVRVVTRVLQR